MVDNPWTLEFWSLTAQGAYIKAYGLSVAQRTARLAGSSVGATRPAVDPAQRIIERQWILRKTVGSTTTSTSSGGMGSAGDGDPT